MKVMLQVMVISVQMKITPSNDENDKCRQKEPLTTGVTESDILLFINCHYYSRPSGRRVMLMTLTADGPTRTDDVGDGGSAVASYQCGD